MIVAASVYEMRVADADLWGHLAAGRLFVERREVPTPDPFSFTANDRDWVAYEWLSEIILWTAYASLGSFGLVLVKCVLGALAIGLVYRSVRLSTDDLRVIAPIVILTASLLRPYLLARPQVFTFAFFAFFALVLWRRLAHGEGSLWPLPLATVVWANLHGGFVAGIGALGLASAAALARGDRRETTALATALSAALVASLATPSGWRLWPAIWTGMTNPYSRRFIAEWQPLPLWPPDLTSALTILLVVSLTIAALGAAVRGKRPAGLSPWLVAQGCLPLGWMAFRSHRHVPPFAILAAPLLAALAAAALDGARRSRWREITILASTGGLALIGAFSVLAVAGEPWPRLQRSGPRQGLPDPTRAIDFARASGVRGNVYTPLWWGSYVTWSLYPAVRVSSDGRNDTLYSLQQIGENLFFYATGEPDLEAPVRSSSDFVLTPARAPVAARLRGDSRWQLRYEDPDAVLFASARSSSDVPESSAGFSNPARSSTVGVMSK